MRVLFLLVALLSCLPQAVAAGSSTLADSDSKPKAGDLLANFSLAVPQAADQAAYLGLTGDSETFALNEIPAKALLIEIFSMYCPFCQKEAPEVNAMFTRLRESELEGELKMLGIGTGNSEYEVGVFRDKFDVSMPLFADPDFTVYNTIGQVGTPFFILARIQPEDQGLKILMVHEGMLQDPQAFLSEIMNRVQNLEAEE